MAHEYNSSRLWQEIAQELMKETDDEYTGELANELDHALQNRYERMRRLYSTVELR